MKNASNSAAMSCKVNSVSSLYLLNYLKSKKVSLVLMTLFSTFLFTACSKQDLNKPASEVQAADNKEISAGTDYLNSTGLYGKTRMELREAHFATERYQDINNAFADGYIDINVVMPNMGYHFEKPSLVDSVFDIKHPELLVYNKKLDGSFKLVAVEYAVPLDQSAKAPRGFTGKADVWNRNTDFGLWLLHAWVWKFNPDGVFNPTNPDVQVR